MKSFKALAHTFALPVALIAGLSAALAASITMEDVNLKVSQLTAPFNSGDTKMEFSFTSLNIDAVKTLDFGFKGLVAKKGSVNDAKVEFKKAEYAYGDGAKPTVDLDVRIDFDIVKALGQETVNAIAQGLDQMVIEAAKDFGKDYGSAGSVDAKIVDKIVDTNGNVEAMKMQLSAAIDFTRLPATKPASEVEFQSLDVMVVAEKTGFSLTVKFVANPLYKGFAVDGNGLKEYVELLLKDDAKTYDELRRYLGMLDGIASLLVEMKP
jgi:hypothetical protein